MRLILVLLAFVIAGASLGTLAGCDGKDGGPGSGGYCLVVDDGTRDNYFGITCRAGTVSGKKCQGGCGAGSVTCN